MLHASRFLVLLLGPTLVVLSGSCATTNGGGVRGTISGGIVADVAERSLPSVVNISSMKVIRSHRGPFFSDPFFRHFFESPLFHREVPRERRERSLGSGVIVSKDGLVLTNNHVVREADEILVHLADGQKLSAKILGTDPKSDVAVLKLQGAPGDLLPMPLGDSGQLRLGETVLAIGNPFGIGQTVTMGIVSAKGRADVGIVDYEDFIQTDAAINPGNSGGALVNLRGELVGINTAILSRSGGYQGIGFAIPSNMARSIMRSIIKHGRVVRGWLGVALQEVTPELAKALDVPATRGALVSDVSPGSPAERAGILRGDVLLSIGGEAINSPQRVRNLVAMAGPDATLSVLLQRGDQRITVRAKLEQQPGSGRAAERADRATEGVLRGLTVEPLSDEVRRRYENLPEIRQGVVVDRVDPGSPAFASGVRRGDLILEVNRQPVDSVSVFAQMAAEARGPVLLLLHRRGQAFYLLVSP